MAQSKQILKQRIRSINATKKITSAMELIANSKLQKQRSLMEKNRDYALTLKETVKEILHNNKGIDNQYLKEKSSTKKLTILFCSDLGLCGGYNVNMMKLVKEFVIKDDPIMLIGTKQANWLNNNGYNVINDVISSDHVTFKDISKLARRSIEMFKEDEISKIQVLYTSFINTVTFKPTLDVLLPYSPDEDAVIEKKVTVETLFEPSPNAILDKLIPMAIENIVYSMWMQTKTSEHSSRRLAMENATDNATELNDKLVLAYNQARQSAITQEITEIVGGADAL
ncbi:MAG: ATP synthase F1 subunit gamma [Anaerorhabdus sp.]